jgi:CRISPR-associated protein Cas2
MIVLILERVPPSLRGDLSRWMFEPRAGVFVGRVTAQVRDRLWERAIHRVRHGACLMVAEESRNEQGFSVRQRGDRSRELVDFDGLTLIRLPHPEGRS